jgi:two-component system NarL family sensor kinase
MEIQVEIGDQRGVGTAYNNIGLIQQELGNIPQALNFYSKALAVRIKMGDKARMGDSDNNLANICIRQGDPDQAIKYLHSIDCGAGRN